MLMMEHAAAGDVIQQDTRISKKSELRSVRHTRAEPQKRPSFEEMQMLMMEHAAAGGRDPAKYPHFEEIRAAKRRIQIDATGRMSLLQFNRRRSSRKAEPGEEAQCNE